jgi:hypothetical protein
MYMSASRNSSGQLLCLLLFKNARKAKNVLFFSKLPLPELMAPSSSRNSIQSQTCPPLLNLFRTIIWFPVLKKGHKPHECPSVRNQRVEVAMSLFRYFIQIREMRALHDLKIRTKLGMLSAFQEWDINIPPRTRSTSTLRFEFDYQKFKVSEAVGMFLASRRDWIEMTRRRDYGEIGFFRKLARRDKICFARRSKLRHQANMALT